MFRFDPNAAFIAADAHLGTSAGLRRVIVALDTAATQTCIHESLLRTLGIDFSSAPKCRLATGNGEVEVAELTLLSMSALGRELPDFKVLAVNMESSSVSGVLGLDFFRDKRLMIDFRNGTIDLQ